MPDLKYALFNKPGAENTLPSLKLAKENADLLGIKKIVVASTTGSTIKAAIDIINPAEYEIICVTHSFGWNEATYQEFPGDLRSELEKKGVNFVSGVLAFSGVDSALLRKFQTFDFVSMFARLVRITMCDGLKVAMEIALMACDAGLTKIGEDVIVVAGTGHGADTCCLIKSASTRMFDLLRVKAILAKPE